ncbi:hypothetical protein INT48_000402 [Thamnidium elegans]|uniref:C2H2-type domain-containing protein n=1 Tax=Thamnidium elegans TaxID=101142 RepID=A0A8H7SJE8_9FUNG|nr:hypothetical protein INT48_000402 [Thamnidium elegans]
MNKPSLPSIQFLLQEAPGPAIPPIDTTNKRQYGHRASRSVSSLPVDLQSLSLQAPEDMVIVPPTVHQHQQPEPQLQEPYNGIPFSTTEKTPSWMLPNDRPMANSPSSSSSSHNRRKPSFAGHGRSVSEFTLPPLSSLNTPPSTTTTRRHASSHRRTVSANTVDFMLSPSPNHQPTIRAQSYSPKEPSLIPQSSSSPPPPPTKLNGNFFEQFENNNNNISNTNTNTQISADTSGRYVCPYCYKKFSRPSSLRIHTYSHTGEKPFVCTEPGCGRHFSVQSNMRRHLRVHRLGRGSSNSNNGLETTNEED